ncbi:hypothetical protein MNBD_ALPHA02-1097 [hydrothermal vent metagenome]|uniref:Carboxymuconolactone decarboxylase-like domain-containing protein n=1 Tax=hydrothermal vent metagenome TaxID=652676 RepID=A0A3B0R6H9_9ZZZZ
MSLLSYSSDFRGIIDIFMRKPDHYLPFTQLLANIMNGDSELSTIEREMIAVHVSTLNNCHYCIGSHKAVLANSGVDKEIISDSENGTLKDKRMDPVLKYASKLTLYPGAIIQEDTDSLRKAGWSDQTIEDIINIVSLFAFLNRLVDGFGIKGSPEVFSQAGEMIAKHGYTPVAQMIRERTSEK